MARNSFHRDMKAVKRVRATEARAARELDRAELATREAIGELKETSRELTERIEEARAHIGVSAEDGEATRILVDPFKPRLPLAASLPM